MKDRPEAMARSTMSGFLGEEDPAVGATAGAPAAGAAPAAAAIEDAPASASEAAGAIVSAPASVFEAAGANEDENGGNPSASAAAGAGIEDENGVNSASVSGAAGAATEDENGVSSGSLVVGNVRGENALGSSTPGPSPKRRKLPESFHRHGSDDGALSEGEILSWMDGLAQAFDAASTEEKENRQIGREIGRAHV